MSTITIANQPTLIQPVYNPLWFRLLSSNYTMPGFKYLVKVYSNTTLVATLKILPGPDNYGVADISKVLKNYASSLTQPKAQLFNVSTGAALKYHCELGECVYGGIVTAVANIGTALRVTIQNGSTTANGKTVSAANLILPGLILSNLTGPYYLKSVGSNNYEVYLTYTAGVFTNPITATGSFTPNGFVQTADSFFSADTFVTDTTNVKIAITAVAEVQDFLSWGNGDNYTMTGTDSLWLTNAPRVKDIQLTDYETLSLLSTIPRQYLLTGGTGTLTNNGDFSQGVKFWEQTVNTAPSWVIANGNATLTYPSGGPNVSNTLYQQFCMYKDGHFGGDTYTYTYSFTANVPTGVTLSMVCDDGHNTFSTTKATRVGSTSGAVTGTFTLTADQCRIGFSAVRTSGFASAQVVTIDDFTLTVTPNSATINSLGEIDILRVIYFTGYNATGTVVSIEDLSNTHWSYQYYDGTFLTPENCRMEVGVGPKNFLANNPATALFNPGVVPTPLSYTLQLFGKNCCAVSPMTPLSEVFTYNIMPAMSDIWEPMRLTWRNLFGGWDYYTFNAVLAKTEKSQRSSYKKVLLYNYTGQDRGETLYHVQADRIWSVATNFVDKPTSDWLRELFLSAESYIINSDATLTPVQVISDTYSYKQKGVNKLMQMHFDLKGAHKIVSNI
jgi:hypothetical protein